MDKLLAKVKLTLEDAHEIMVPNYLEVVDADDELIGTLEKMDNGWQLRVDGHFVDYITE